MKQLWIEAPYREGALVPLPPKASRYVGRVLRLQAGDVLTVLTADGVPCHALVVSEGERVQLQLEAPLSRPCPVGHPPLILVASLLKGSKNEAVIRQAVQVGAQRLFVVRAEHSVYGIKEERERGRMERWQAVAAEAGQQSGNPNRVEVTFCPSFEAFFPPFEAACPGCAALVFHEKEMPENSLFERLAGFLQTPSSEKGLALFVGPEGGFSQAELAAFSEKGYPFVWMGPTVMRAETACTTALAVVSLLLREKDRWCLATKKK